MAIIETGQIEVCSNCLMVAVNGDDTGRHPDDPEPWNLIPGAEQIEYVYGTTDHVGTCDVNLEWTRDDHECDCADTAFSRRTCDACGDLPGARFTFTRLQNQPVTHDVGAPCGTVSAGDETLTDPEERADITCPACLHRS